VFDLHQRFGIDVIALSEFVKLRYTPNPTDGNRVRRVLKRLFLIRAARRYLATERPDIIHVHDESSALAWGLAAKQAEIPLVWHVHQQASQPAVDWILRRLATHVVFVADTNRCRFRTLNGVSHSVIYNGVDLGTFRPRDQPSHNAPSIGFISNLVDRKRPDWVIRAAGHLVRHGLDVRVVIAGNDFTMGIKTETLRTLAEREGLSGRCEFLGYRSDVFDVLQQVDILALPSMRNREAFPRIIVEAMACGIPVVATNVAGIPEAVRDGETGSLVDPDNFDGFAEALSALVSDPERRRRYRAAALTYSKQLFSIESSVDAVDQLYRRLLRGHRRGR
jgi:glycosyltransferase involved in cell wall biosynthesis